MTDLIVALDLPVYRAIDLAAALIARAGVNLFKIGWQTLLQPGGLELTARIGNASDLGLFLDLKLYDVSDTVEAAARRAFDLGARFLTVHATLSMIDAAMRAKPAGDYAKVLAVDTLTDGNGFGFLPRSTYQADGIICSVIQAGEIRSRYAGLLVCPGIRPAGAAPDNHALAATPAQAKAAGADFIVVGRPIINADDPAAAARAILADLSGSERSR